MRQRSIIFYAQRSQLEIKGRLWRTNWECSPKHHCSPWFMKSHFFTYEGIKQTLLLWTKVLNLRMIMPKIRTEGNRPTLPAKIFSWEEGNVPHLVIFSVFHSFACKRYQLTADKISKSYPIYLFINFHA